MTDNQAEANALEDVMTEKEACELLGIAEVTLWRERKKGRISFIRVGGKIRYFRSDVLIYLNRNRHQATAA